VLLSVCACAQDLNLNKGDRVVVDAKKKVAAPSTASDGSESEDSEGEGKGDGHEKGKVARADGQER
jgi:hypothetical protein